MDSLGAVLKFACRCLTGVRPLFSVSTVTIIMLCRKVRMSHCDPSLPSSRLVSPHVRFSGGPKYVPRIINNSHHTLQIFHLPFHPLPNCRLGGVRSCALVMFNSVDILPYNYNKIHDCCQTCIGVLAHKIIM